MIVLPTVDARAKAMEIKLKASIWSGLYKGFIATFGDRPTKETLSCAERFANEAVSDISEGVSSAIADFLKTTVVNIPSAPQASLACAAGPVSGTVLIPDNMITIG